MPFLTVIIVHLEYCREMGIKTDESLLIRDWDGDWPVYVRPSCEHDRDYTVVYIIIKLGRHVNYDEGSDESKVKCQGRHGQIRIEIKSFNIFWLNHRLAHFTTNIAHMSGWTWFLGPKVKCKDRNGKISKYFINFVNMIELEKAVFGSPFVVHDGKMSHIDC